MTMRNKHRADGGLPALARALNWTTSTIRRAQRTPLGLVADANFYSQLAQEWEATAPAAAASYRDKAQRLQAAATAFLKLPDPPAVGAGGELSIPEREIR